MSKKAIKTNNTYKQSSIKICICLVVFLAIFSTLSIILFPMMENSFRSNALANFEKLPTIEDAGFEPAEFITFSEFFNRFNPIVFHNDFSLIPAEHERYFEMPIMIETPRELHDFSFMANGRHSPGAPQDDDDVRPWIGEHYRRRTYFLGNNIDYSEMYIPGYAVPRQGFLPVGSIEHPFEGSFFGQGFEIKNLFFNVLDLGDINHIAMFAHTRGAQIRGVGLNFAKNYVNPLQTLNMYNANISIAVSALVGEATDGTIISCSYVLTCQAPNPFYIRSRFPHFTQSGLVGHLVNSTLSRSYFSGRIWGGMPDSSPTVANLTGSWQGGNTVFYNNNLTSDTFSHSIGVSNNNLIELSGAAGILRQECSHNYANAGIITRYRFYEINFVGGGFSFRRPPMLRGFLNWNDLSVLGTSAANTNFAIARPADLVFFGEIAAVPESAAAANFFANRTFYFQNSIDMTQVSVYAYRPHESALSTATSAINSTAMGWAFRGSIDGVAGAWNAHNTARRFLGSYISDFPSCTDNPSQAINGSHSIFGLNMRYYTRGGSTNTRFMGLVPRMLQDGTGISNLNLIGGQLVVPRLDPFDPHAVSPAPNHTFPPVGEVDHKMFAGSFAGVIEGRNNSGLRNIHSSMTILHEESHAPNAPSLIGRTTMIARTTHVGGLVGHFRVSSSSAACRVEMTSFSGEIVSGYHIITTAYTTAVARNNANAYGVQNWDTFINIFGVFTGGVFGSFFKDGNNTAGAMFDVRNYGTVTGPYIFGLRPNITGIIFYQTYTGGIAGYLAHASTGAAGGYLSGNSTAVRNFGRVYNVPELVYRFDQGTALQANRTNTDMFVGGIAGSLVIRNGLHLHQDELLENRYDDSVANHNGTVTIREFRRVSANPWHTISAGGLAGDLSNNHSTAFKQLNGLTQNGKITVEKSRYANPATGTLINYNLHIGGFFGGHFIENRGTGTVVLAESSLVHDINVNTYNVGHTRVSGFGTGIAVRNSIVDIDINFNQCLDFFTHGITNTFIPPNVLVGTRHYVAGFSNAQFGDIENSKSAVNINVGVQNRDLTLGWVRLAGFSNHGVWGTVLNSTSVAQINLGTQSNYINFNHVSIAGFNNRNAQSINHARNFYPRDSLLGQADSQFSVNVGRTGQTLRAFATSAFFAIGGITDNSDEAITGNVVGTGTITNSISYFDINIDSSNISTQRSDAVGSSTGMTFHVNGITRTSSAANNNTNRTSFILDRNITGVGAGGLITFNYTGISYSSTSRIGNTNYGDFTVAANLIGVTVRPAINAAGISNLGTVGTVLNSARNNQNHGHMTINDGVLVGAVRMGGISVAGRVDNSTNYGNITFRGNSNGIVSVGGILAAAPAVAAVIIESTNRGNVTVGGGIAATAATTFNIGGIAGIAAQTTTAISIVDSFNRGSVSVGGGVVAITATTLNVGGIAGVSGAITNSANVEGEAQFNIDAPIVVANMSIGGVAGNTASTANITNTHNHFDIIIGAGIIVSGVLSVGGIAGGPTWPVVISSNNFGDVRIESTMTTATVHIGGVVGHGWHLTSVRNYGQVSVDANLEVTLAMNIGGLAGVSGTISGVTHNEYAVIFNAASIIPGIRIANLNFGGISGNATPGGMGVITSLINNNDVILPLGVSVTGVLNMGGLAGLALGITSSHNTAQVSILADLPSITTIRIGGLAGQVGGAIGTAALPSTNALSVSFGVSNTISAVNIYFGGLVGNHTSGTISSSNNNNVILPSNVTVSGTLNIGGVAGFATAISTAHNHGEVRIDTRTGNATMSTVNINMGGLSGRATTLTSSHNYANVSIAANLTVSGIMNIGGLAGLSTGVSASTIMHNNNAVIFENNPVILVATLNFGGLVGNAASGTITSSNNNPVVLPSSVTVTGMLSMGGIAGIAWGISSANNSAPVTLNAVVTDATVHIGGLAGQGAVFTTATNTVTGTVNLGTARTIANLNFGGLVGTHIGGAINAASINNSPISIPAGMNIAGTLNFGGVAGNQTTAAANSIAAMSAHNVSLIGITAGTINAGAVVGLQGAAVTTANMRSISVQNITAVTLNVGAVAGTRAGISTVAYGSNTGNVFVENITAVFINVGGMVGMQTAGSIISFSPVGLIPGANHGNIEVINITTPVTTIAIVSVGGIVGNQSGGTGQIRGINHGDILISGISTVGVTTTAVLNVGGIAGIAAATLIIPIAVVTQAVNYGTITVQDTLISVISSLNTTVSALMNIGGLVGQQTGTYSQITASINQGAILLHNSSATAMSTSFGAAAHTNALMSIGGLVGEQAGIDSLITAVNFGPILTSGLITVNAFTPGSAIETALISVGGIAGRQTVLTAEIASSINEGYINIEVAGNLTAGGIVGQQRGIVSLCVNRGNLTITNTLSAAANVVGSRVGGITGHAISADAEGTVYIDGCVNTGFIQMPNTMSGSHVGGIVGTVQAGNHALANVTVQNNLNGTVFILITHNTTAITNNFAGGIAGYTTTGANTLAQVNLFNNVNYATVQTNWAGSPPNASTFSTGGILGGHDSAAFGVIRVENAVNHGNVLDISGGARRAGGIIGHFIGTNRTLTNVVNYGFVQGAGGIIGGIIGEITNAGTVAASHMYNIVYVHQYVTSTPSAPNIFGASAGTVIDEDTTQLRIATTNASVVENSLLNPGRIFLHSDDAPVDSVHNGGIYHSGFFVRAYDNTSNFTAPDYMSQGLVYSPFGNLEWWGRDNWQPSTHGRHIFAVAMRGERNDDDDDNTTLRMDGIYLPMLWLLDDGEGNPFRHPDELPLDRQEYEHLRQIIQRVENELFTLAIVDRDGRTHVARNYIRYYDSSLTIDYHRRQFIFTVTTDIIRPNEHGNIFSFMPTEMVYTVGREAFPVLDNEGYWIRMNLIEDVDEPEGVGFIIVRDPDDHTVYRRWKVIIRFRPVARGIWLHSLRLNNIVVPISPPSASVVAGVRTYDIRVPYSGWPNAGVLNHGFGLAASFDFVFHSIGVPINTSLATREMSNLSPNTPGFSIRRHYDNAYHDGGNTSWTAQTGHNMVVAERTGGGEPPEDYPGQLRAFMAINSAANANALRGGTFEFELRFEHGAEIRRVIIRFTRAKSAVNTLATTGNNFMTTQNVWAAFVVSNNYSATEGRLTFDALNRVDFRYGFVSHQRLQQVTRANFIGTSGAPMLLLNPLAGVSQFMTISQIQEVRIEPFTGTPARPGARTYTFKFYIQAENGSIRNWQAIIHEAVPGSRPASGTGAPPIASLYWDDGVTVDRQANPLIPPIVDRNTAARFYVVYNNSTDLWYPTAGPGPFSVRDRLQHRIYRHVGGGIWQTPSSGIISPTVSVQNRANQHFPLLYITNGERMTVSIVNVAANTTGGQWRVVTYAPRVYRRIDIDSDIPNIHIDFPTAVDDDYVLWHEIIYQVFEFTITADNRSEATRMFFASAPDTALINFDDGGTPATGATWARLPSPADRRVGDLQYNTGAFPNIINPYSIDRIDHFQVRVIYPMNVTVDREAAVLEFSTEVWFDIHLYASLFKWNPELNAGAGDWEHIFTKYDAATAPIGRWVYQVDYDEEFSARFKVVAEDPSFHTIYDVLIALAMISNKAIELTVNAPIDFNGFAAVTLFTYFYTENIDPNEIGTAIVTRASNMFFDNPTIVGGVLSQTFRMRNHLNMFYSIAVHLPPGYTFTIDYLMTGAGDEFLQPRTPRNPFYRYGLDLRYRPRTTTFLTITIHRGRPPWGITSNH